MACVCGAEIQEEGLHREKAPEIEKGSESAHVSEEATWGQGKSLHKAIDRVPGAYRRLSMSRRTS